MISWLRKQMPNTILLYLKESHKKIEKKKLETEAVTELMNKTRMPMQWIK